jgi:hypothetical protein
MQHPIAFDASVSADTFMRVCSSSADLKYEEPPATTVEARGYEKGIGDNIYKLRKGQVDCLEKTLGMSLTNIWFNSRREHAYIADRRFSKRPDGYFEVTSFGDKQLTDFTMDIEHYEVKNDEVFVHLEVVKDNNFYSFVASHDLLSHTNVVYKLRDFLLRNGVSLVYINPVYGRILPEVINAFSPSVRVEYTPAQKLKKPTRKKLVVDGNDITQ